MMCTQGLKFNTIDNSVFHQNSLKVKLDFYFINFFYVYKNILTTILDIPYIVNKGYNVSLRI